MQFGIFAVGDLTANPTTGRTLSGHERIRNTVEPAVKAEEVGLDVVAGGGDQRPPFVPSSPTSLRGCIAACTSRLILSTSGSGATPSARCSPAGRRPRPRAGAG
jgi:hypothetical protein